MGTAQQSQHSVTTGILSKGERAFFRGEKDPSDPDGYKRNARYRARQRMNRIEKDLELLREAGQEDLVEEFYNRFSETTRLREEVEELREQVEKD